MNDSPQHPTLASRVLARIATERPRPRFAFVLENATFWTLGAVAVALGAVAFSAILFELQNSGWELYEATHPDFMTFFLSVAPFLWVVALGLFLAIGFVNIRFTKRGYRYPLSVIAVGAVLTSVTLGSALYATGLGARVDEAIGDHPPFYRPALEIQETLWNDPKDGRLGGTIISIGSTTDSFVVRDFSGRTWSVDVADVSRTDRIALARGGLIRLVGLPQTLEGDASAVFHACFVFPWKFFGKRDAPPPPPLTMVASSTETSASGARTDVCKGIRPYDALRALDEKGL